MTALVMAASQIAAVPQPAPRQVGMDTYRGFVMLLMLAEVLSLPRVARAFPDNTFWQFVAFHTSHVAWVGGSLHDMIQPSFSFLVGVALPFSLASRMAKGASFRTLFRHALWRSFVLIALGILLRSTHSPQTNFTFEDTLTQIGLGYPFLFLLGFASQRVAWGALAAILVGYWGAWALYPVAPPGFDWGSVGVPPDWPHHATGFAAHWNKNHNLGTAFDQWFLNLFPRVKPFVANGGGYLTLSFIPTLGTMILGLIAGRWLQQKRELRQFLIAGAACFGLALALHFLGLCPIVKRIWTPSWTLASGGVCFAMLAAFTWVTDRRGHQRAAYPLLVIGRNSIAAYLLAHLIDGFTAQTIRTHLEWLFHLLGQAEPVAISAGVLVTYWLILYWLDRRRIYLKV